MTTSNNDIINYPKSILRQFERIKHIQKIKDKKIKYSNNYNKIINKLNSAYDRMYNFKRDFVEKKTGLTLRFIGSGKVAALNRVDYDKAWETILNTTPESILNVPGAFVDWDNTPRHGERGRVYIGKTPEKFEKYLSEQIRRAKNVYHKDMIFMYAWNEWAEGGYLEPDQTSGYAYLEAIKKALDENGENPWQH